MYISGHMCEGLYGCLCSRARFLGSRPGHLIGVGLRGLGSLHLRQGVVHTSLMQQATSLALGDDGLFLLYNPWGWGRRVVLCEGLMNGCDFECGQVGSLALPPLQIVRAVYCVVSRLN